MSNYNFWMIHAIIIGLQYFCDYIIMATIVVIVAAHISWKLSLWLGNLPSGFLTSMYVVIQLYEVSFIIPPIL